MGNGYGKLKTEGKNITIRVVSIVIIVISFILFFYNFIFGLPALNDLTQIKATQGQATIGEYNYESSPPILLEGEWEYYPGVFLQGDQITQATLKNTGYINIPIIDSNDDITSATYKVSANMANLAEDMVLFIPNTYDEVNLYVNGTKQPKTKIQQNWMSFGLMQASFSLTNLQEGKQEIVISTITKNGDYPLFTKKVLISTYDNILTYNVLNIINSLFILGIIIIILINGAIFMIIKPNHKLITLINLFDTFLIFRIILGLADISSLLPNPITNYVISQHLALELQIIVLMVAGIFGMLLSKYLFDEDGKTPKAVINTFCLAYGALAVFIPLNLHSLDSVGIYLMVGVCVASFGVVFVQAKSYLKKEMSMYRMFQVVKTVYIGIVIVFDILSLTTKTSFLSFTYLYIIFFLCHIFVRLYDNNLGYREAEFLNKNLEQTVKERTLELSKANAILSELSVKDALTGAYNRLYFENIMEEELEKCSTQHPMYVCMFDLDYFKQINDKYGHDAGDEQLIQIVKNTREVVGDKGLLARIGGEEFVVIYVGIPQEEAYKYTENLRVKFEGEAAKTDKFTTASFGLIKNTEKRSVSQVMKQADIYLYKAKNNGRNKIETNINEELQ